MAWWETGKKEAAMRQAQVESETIFGPFRLVPMTRTGFHGGKRELYYEG